MLGLSINWLLNTVSNCSYCLTCGKCRLYKAEPVNDNISDWTMRCSLIHNSSGFKYCFWLMLVKSARWKWNGSSMDHFHLFGDNCVTCTDTVTSGALNVLYLSNLLQRLQCAMAVDTIFKHDQLAPAIQSPTCTSNPLYSKSFLVKCEPCVVLNRSCHFPLVMVSTRTICPASVISVH